MRQTTDNCAELDLTQVGGQPFSYTDFRAQVIATFQDPTDGFTDASLFVQMPQKANGIGGYIFELMTSEGGDWTLLHVDSDKTEQGTSMIKSSVVFSPFDSVTDTMTALVRDGSLSVYLNGDSQPLFNQVLSLNPSPAAFGLMVCNLFASKPSSYIYFTQFELDAPAA
jgi:hypothetical protein